MKIKNNILKIAVAGTMLLSLDACTKLDETTYDTLRSDQFYTNKNEIISAVLRPYTHANAWATPSGQDGWWRPSELSADQLAWPTKGRHGEDGGKWKRLHYHTWTVDEGGLNNAWSLMYWGIGLCNVPIQNIEKQDAAAIGLTDAEKNSYIAELKLLRAYHYLKLMDLFGNIPIVTESPSEPIPVEQYPANSTRKEVFDFVEKEILDNIDQAPKLSKGMLGRMSQAGGYAMLVELYLNAEVWSGTPRWDDCIAAADKLINNQAGGLNGAMMLDSNINDAFKPNNDLSKESIFSIAYEFKMANFQPSWTGEFYHFNQDLIYGGSRTGNDGVVLVPGVYTTFDNADKRKSEWLLEGPMVRFDNGKPVIATGGNEYDGQQLVFVDNIRRNKLGETTSNMSNGEENSGVRFNKYKLGNQVPSESGIPADPNYNNTDWNLYRLSWIYFAKAEAIMRKNGGVADGVAVQLVNDCKKRAYATADWADNAYTTATLTLNELLAERGREFIFEGFRRDDLIRFGKFTTASWWDHTPSATFRNLFAIPQQQVILNPQLKQNAGY
ncbi:RagB/SusD family nutrient uptake outer membrane protein [Mucilaginibacter sp. UR6-1]|uniref:RagB/SusD family nutrient uptake outer membrane protein n=1 Tax=Mucilaginibacter sp. UR6-1 TaxID=1435643 RepID=UPI001E47A778|nr:RagB/SusD family nutrient uptake outer membrane protein [Mucilaginibacter sp. UR6-1]MCC8408830.1 RagB/SusD family nutrient uptake outer membrane protein [Mucilaginibacter sp. UR6-1]